MTTGIDPLKWNSIVPYFPAVRLCVFRFKSPLKGPADLHWAFTLPTTFSLWYILPVRASRCRASTLTVSRQNGTLTFRTCPTRLAREWSWVNFTRGPNPAGRRIYHLECAV